MGIGRPPKQSRLRLVEGRANTGVASTENPSMRAGRPPKPLTLSPRAEPFWDETCDILEKMEVLTEVDGIAVELLCEVRGEWHEARDLIKKYGVMYQRDGLWKLNPAVPVRDQSNRRIHSLITEFGLTPAARTKVKTVSNKDNDDPAAAYF